MQVTNEQGRSWWRLADPLGRFSDVRWKGDLFGGVTTAVISLPLALTFGVASGAGAQAGLTGAVMVGLFAALFGGSRTLISEPTGPMTVIMTAVVAKFVATDPQHGVSMAFAVVLVAGLTQAALGVMRLGRYITLMPYSVISGFMSGIGVLLVLMQIYPMVGLTPPKGGALGAVTGLPQLLQGARWQELSLAAFGMLVLFGMPSSWKKWCPPHLLALVTGTVLAAVAFPPDAYRQIGAIPMGLPDFQVPYFSAGQISVIVTQGLILGLLGCIDTLLTAVIADSLTRKAHDSNRELIGQGLANSVSALFGGLPGAGATMGTVVNIQVGARSPVAGVVRALLLLVVALFLAPLLKTVPLAILAAIAVKVGMDILDWSFLKRAHIVSGTAALIMYGVMTLTVFVDLVIAVGVGVFISNILTIDRLSRIQADRVRSLDVTDDEIPLNAEERALFEQGGGDILLFHLSGPMIFGVANAITREQEALVHARVLVMDLSDVPIMSTTVALALENVIKDARGRGVPVILCAGSENIRRRMERIRNTSSVQLTLASSRREALEAALALLETLAPGDGQLPATA